MASNQDFQDRVTVLDIKNLSQDINWKDYHTLFSKFGKVIKLYIAPSGEYGRVYFENAITAEKVCSELNKKPPLNLSIKILPDPDQLSLTTSNNSSIDLELPTKMSNRRYNKNYNDELVISNDNLYVDVFGRPLVTFEGDNGEVYIGLSELKKSGFNIFLAEEFPNLNEIRIDEELRNHLEMYLKIKTAKLLSSHKYLHLSEETVREIADGVKNQVLSMAQSHPLMNSKVTLPSHSASGVSHFKGKERGRSITSTDRKHDPNQSGRSSERRNDRHFAGTTNNGFSNNTSQLRRPRPSVDSYEGNQPRTYNTGNRSHKQDFRNGPSKKPSVSQEKSYDNGQKEKDWGASTSSPAKEIKLPRITISNDKCEKNALSSTNMPSPTVEKPVTKPESKTNPSTPTREVAIENLSENGLFVYTGLISEDSFLAYAIPFEYTEELSLLDTMNTDPDIKTDPHFKPKLGDLVAIPYQDGYTRGTIINNTNGKFSCAAIDFGIVLVVDAVYRLPEKYKNIAEFSCLCKTDPGSVKDIKEGKVVDVKIESPWLLKIKLENSDKQYEVKGCRWDPFVTSTIASVPVEKQKQVVFKTRPKEKQLKPGDIVIIGNQIDGCLMVRTREGNNLFNEIEKEIKLYKAQPFLLQPEVNQLILCPFNDDALYRAIVLSVKGTNFKVYYLDYGNVDIVPIEKCRTISEKLANLDISSIKLSLQGFVGVKFVQKAAEFLAICSKNKEKFTVIAGDSTDVFDLAFQDNSTLSEKLINLDNPSVPAKSEPAIIKWDDIPQSKFDTGMNKVICLFNGHLDMGSVTFCSNSDEVLSSMAEVIDKIKVQVEKDSMPYRPQKSEMCLAMYEGDWFRASVEEITDAGYTLVYIDYGNCSMGVKESDIRKMPREFAEIECAAVTCTLQDFTKVKNLPKLKTSIQENGTYDINVLSEKNGIYEITIPSLKL